MEIKRISAGIALCFMVLTASAQEIQPNPVGGGILDPSEEQAANESVNAAQTDSLSLLSNELAQLKSRLDQTDREQYLEKVWKRRKYLKIGFDNLTIKRTDGAPLNWKTDFAISITKGRTAYLHSKPLWGRVKFGIDYGFLNMSYAKLKPTEAESSTSPFPSTPNPGGGFDEIVSDDPSGSIASLTGVDLGMHKIDYSLHVGPSISVNPWKHLIIAAYFHAVPVASMLLIDDTFSYGFGCAFSAGVSVSYKAISVGVEGVWSTIKYTQSSFEEEEGDYNDEYAEDSSNLFDTEKFKLKQSGPRFYVAFRF